MIKVLIVEDDFVVADNLEEILVEAGYEVCGIAGSVARAIELGERHNPALGVIDLRLSGGEYGTEIAASLRRRGGFGVLYATGNPTPPAPEPGRRRGLHRQTLLGQLCGVCASLRQRENVQASRVIRSSPGFKAA